MKSRTPISDGFDDRLMNCRYETDVAPVAAALLLSHEQMESDAITMALRLYGEDEATLSPECYEVMRRWRPKVEALIASAHEPAGIVDAAAVSLTDSDRGKGWSEILESLRDKDK